MPDGPVLYGSGSQVEYGPAGPRLQSLTAELPRRHLELGAIWQAIERGMEISSLK